MQLMQFIDIAKFCLILSMGVGRVWLIQFVAIFQVWLIQFINFGHVLPISFSTTSDDVQSNTLYYLRGSGHRLPVFMII